MSAKIKYFLLLAALALLAADKSEPEPATKPPKADIRGKVTAVAALRAQGLVGRISVEGAKEKDTEHDKASVTLTSKTKILKWEGGKKKKATFADIKKGTKVQCVFVGPVLESYPVQAKAGEVLILAAAK
jgi:beta-N-acetylhexosaminidase